MKRYAMGAEHELLRFSYPKLIIKSPLLIYNYAYHQAGS